MQAIPIMIAGRYMLNKSDLGGGVNDSPFVDDEIAVGKIVDIKVNGDLDITL